MSNADISLKPPPIIFIGDAEDIDEILAKFPGPVSISQNRFLSDRTRLIGGLGCVGMLSIPGVLLFINAITIASWGWGLFAFAARSPWPL